MSALLLQVFYGSRRGTPVDGATGLQSPVPVVRGAFARRSDVEPDRITKNRDWLQTGEVFAKFMSELLNHPQVRPLFCRTSIFWWTEH